MYKRQGLGRGKKGLAVVDEDAPLESAAPRPTMPAKPLTKTSMADVYAFMFGEDPPDSV